MTYYIINPKDKITIYGCRYNPDTGGKVEAFSYLENAVVELTANKISHLLDFHKCELTQHPYRDDSFIPVEKLIKLTRQKKAKVL